MFPEKQARSELPCGRDYSHAHKQGLGRGCAASRAAQWLQEVSELAAWGARVEPWGIDKCVPLTESEVRCWEVSGCSGCGVMSREGQGGRLEAEPSV